MIDQFIYATNTIFTLVGMILIGIIFATISNFIADRVASRQSVFGLKPYCKHCATQLTWKDIIPVFSYLSHHGSCRYCGMKLPLRYLVTDGIAITWVALFIAKYGWSYHGILILVFGMALISFIIMEMENHRISDSLLIMMMFLSVIYYLAFEPIHLPAAIFSMIAAGILALVFNEISRILDIRKTDNGEAIRFAATLGLFLGFFSFFLCYITALLGIGAFHVWKTRIRGSSDRVRANLSLSLAISAMVVLLWGLDLKTLYMGLIS